MEPQAGALEAYNGTIGPIDAQPEAIKAHNRAVKALPGALGFVCRLVLQICVTLTRIRIRIKVKSWVRIQIQICIKVKKSDLDPHQSEKTDPDKVDADSNFL